MENYEIDPSRSDNDRERKMNEFKKIVDDRRKSVEEVRNKSPLTAFSRDFFARFIKGRNELPLPDEVTITGDWTVSFDPSASGLIRIMASHLTDFFRDRMRVCLRFECSSIQDHGRYRISLGEKSGGNGEQESFTIDISDDRIEISGNDPCGLRNAVVRFIGLIGMRRAPFVKKGRTVYAPGISTRLVSLDSIETNVFYGANAVLLSWGNLYGLSTSDAIPELKKRRDPSALASLLSQAEEARKYGLKMYLHVSIMEKFDKDDEIFKKHPDIRGALTWKEDGQYTICTEHPLVIRYLTESIEGIFRAIPDLSGISLIIGGEGFYHCFMRAYGVEKGHTNCKRCEPLGAERVVANLCNNLLKAARKSNPDAKIIAWPYSAAFVWSSDAAQEGLMRLLDPGVSILTEFEKDEIVTKPGGTEKLLWDYSIDLIGPGIRATRQLEVSKETGNPVISLSMAEMSFELPLLPCVPVHDRWIDRAAAITKSGAEGIYLWNMAPYNGMSSGELYQYYWFSPYPDKETLLLDIAGRITGNRIAAGYLREAWRECSNGFWYIPTVPAYYSGPHYLGPAHPVVIDPRTEISKTFYGYYLFLMEISPDNAMEPLQIYRLDPGSIGGYNGPESLPLLETYYKVVEDHLKRAVRCLDKADPLIPAENTDIYEAESLPVRWFCHTSRTLGNLYEIFRLSERIAGLSPDTAGSDEIKRIFARFREILLDEKDNSICARPVAGKDPRLETLHRGDSSFFSINDMLDEKISILDDQLDRVLPEMEKLETADIIYIYKYEKRKTEGRMDSR